MCLLQPIQTWCSGGAWALAASRAPPLSLSLVGYLPFAFNSTGRGVWHVVGLSSRDRAGGGGGGAGLRRRRH